MKSSAQPLPEKAIEEFKAIYEKNNGKKISDEEATKLANRFIHLMYLVYENNPRYPPS